MRRRVPWLGCCLAAAVLAGLGCQRDPGPKYTFPTTPLPDVKDLKISASGGGAPVPAVPPAPAVPQEGAKDQAKDKGPPPGGEKSKADK